MEFRGIVAAAIVRAVSVKSLPLPLRGIAWMLPTTHSFEGMRQILAGGRFSPAHFWWALGLNAVYFALAVIFFRWIFEASRSRGLLVKLDSGTHPEPIDESNCENYSLKNE